MGCTSSRPEFPNDIHPNIFSASLVVPNGKIIKGKLEVTPTTLVLHQKRMEPVLWPLHFLRRYGYEQNLFSFESGRRCKSGPGIFTFRCPRAQDLFLLVQSNVQEVGSDGRSRTTATGGCLNSSSTGTHRRNGSRSENGIANGYLRTNGDVASCSHQASPSEYHAETFIIPQEAVSFTSPSYHPTPSPRTPHSNFASGTRSIERNTRFLIGEQNVTETVYEHPLGNAFTEVSNHTYVQQRLYQPNTSNANSGGCNCNLNTINPQPNMNGSSPMRYGSDHLPSATPPNQRTLSDSLQPSLMNVSFTPSEVTLTDNQHGRVAPPLQFNSGSSERIIENAYNSSDVMSSSTASNNEVFQETSTPTGYNRQNSGKDTGSSFVYDGLVHPYINITPGSIYYSYYYDKNPARKRTCASDSSVATAFSEQPNWNGSNYAPSRRQPPPIPPRSRYTKLTPKTVLPAPRRTWSQPSGSALNHSYVNLIEGLPPAFGSKCGPLEYVTVNLATPNGHHIRRSSTSSMRAARNSASSDSRNYALIDSQKTKALRSSANPLRAVVDGSLPRTRHGSTVSQHSYNGPSFSFV